MEKTLRNYFSPLDVHFGRFISSFVPQEHQDDLFLAAALVSRSVKEGNICLDLHDAAGKVLFQNDVGEDAVVCPPLEAWKASLQKAPCVARPGQFRPLVLDEKNRLYLHRYWEYEHIVARYFSAGIFQQSNMKFDESSVQEKLGIYFEEEDSGWPNWQKVAAAAALMKKVLIITGSPGTGKTTTITKIMTLIQDVAFKPLRIALTAPTGKAAARLQETVRKLKDSMVCSEALKEKIPHTAQTIHRLLGYIRYSPYFRFDEKNPLPYDLVVVDEASMVDLPLMAKLIAALPTHASLILLGDKDQLASVEVGIVLGDLCAMALPNVFSSGFAREVFRLSGQQIETDDSPGGIQDNIVHLQKNYRFAADSGIHILSQAVKNGESEKTLNLLRQSRFADMIWVPWTTEKEWFEKLEKTVLRECQSYWENVLCGATDCEKIFDLLEEFRILCALRVGSWGTEKINRFVEHIFHRAGFIRTRDAFYEGMPVMILQNDYHLRLFNGDIGIVLKAPEQHGRLAVFFRDEQKKTRGFLPSRLPQHETAWAMTVHKSQGSEFAKVLLLLGNFDVPLMTRELIYTGITRARQSVEIWAGESLLGGAVSRKISRKSGLADALLAGRNPSGMP